MADLDPESWSAWWAALLGPAGGGAAIIKQVRAQARTEQRLQVLESDAAAFRTKDEKHDAALLQIEKTLSTLEERSKTGEDDRREILTILREKL